MNIASGMGYFAIYVVNFGHDKRRISPMYQPRLSERYQLSENLRTLRLFRKTIVYISFFNLVSTLSCTPRMIQMSPIVTNISYEVFDLSFAMYGLVLPIMTLRSEECWRKAAQKVLSSRRPFSWYFQPPSEPSSMFSGLIRGKAESDIYFQQLSGQWKH
ncbi:SRE-9 protein [Aphelenchoides avenae]|nr:SRE-9 protein [Aphelenchus avenae]